MASSWGTSWLSSWLNSWGTQGVAGSGVLVCSSATVDGAGTVTGVGTPGQGRKHRVTLDYEPISHRL